MLYQSLSEIGFNLNVLQDIFMRFYIPLFANFVAKIKTLFLFSTDCTAILINHAKNYCNWESFRGWNEKKFTYTYYVMSTKFLKINFPGAVQQSIWILSSVRTSWAPKESYWHFYQTILWPYKKLVLQNLKVMSFYQKTGSTMYLSLRPFGPKINQKSKARRLPDGKNNDGGTVFKTIFI